MREWLVKYGWLFAWLVLVATAYLVRGLLPIDETRYLSVAWEMWLRDDFLVPYANGEPYSHKPPLLFWLFHAGWLIFGVNEWWPRLVPPLFALAGLYLSQLMARRLWPERPQVALLAPWILCSSLLWALYSTATLFDMLLMSMVMLALLGLLRASAGYSLSGWLLVGIAAGLGILIKGPVVLLHIAFPMLLAPWWSETARQRPLYWYGSMLAAATLATLIALAWVLPAAFAGGTAYEHAILWHQTADRMVSSFAHRRPLWWYLPLLPLLLFPWFIWPPLWRALAALRQEEERSVRFLLSCLLPTFIAFSLLSGKQLHYLLPIFPAFALLAARALDSGQQGVRRLDQLLPALFMAGTGLALLLLPLLPVVKRLPGWEWAQAISPFWGAAILLLAANLYMRTWQRHAVITLALSGITVAVLVMGGILPALRSAYDVAPAARFLSQLEEQGALIANLDTYHDQFQFLGRLKKPLAEINNNQLAAWCRSHPDGYVVMYKRQAPAKTGSQPAYMQQYRDQWLTIWPVRHMPER